jgi:uncharacterized protein YeaO (DUF488 family)
MAIKVKRAYEKPSRGDGKRVLVDRLWPRGISKEAAKIDLWVKEAAPSSELRKWFGHEPEKWGDFQKRYFKELDKKPEAVKELEKAAHKGSMTLVYGAKDEEHNNAVALKVYLEKHGQ